jgi:hypothetical protein
MNIKDQLITLAENRYGKITNKGFAIYGGILHFFFNFDKPGCPGTTGLVTEKEL